MQTLVLSIAIAFALTLIGFVLEILARPEGRIPDGDRDDQMALILLPYRIRSDGRE